MKPLVCIFAHPDDESFGPGGTIAKYAKARDIYLICVTSVGGKLGSLRKKELLESSKILGVKKVKFLDFEDGGLCNNLYHQLAGKIEAILKLYKPDTLLTFEQRGVSGHIDHISVSMVSAFIFKKLDFIKRILYFAETEEKIAELGKDYFIYMPPGIPREKADLIVDIGDFWETKVEAMKAHKSQQGDVDWLLKVFTKFEKKEYFLAEEKV